MKFRFLLPFLVIGCAPTEAPDSAAESGADNPAVDAVFAAWTIDTSPGCALAVAQDGEIVYSRGYGLANLDYGIPVGPQTVFDVASITKQFVAALVNMLAAEGRLSLDDDVRKWLPELPEYDTPILLRHMIYHTSGLRDYLNLFPLAGRGDYFPISHDQILQMMSRQRELVFPPGERYLYSNTAYMLLAQIIERVSGQSFGDIAQVRIFEPLGMKSSLMYDNLEYIIPLRATGYSRDSDGGFRVVHNYNFDVAGDGQLYSTMEDLLRWTDYLHGARRPSFYSTMMEEGQLNDGQVIAYAQGLELESYRGLQTVGHSGSSWGFRSQLTHFPEAGLSIAISCNDDTSSPGQLMRDVADYYLADRLAADTRKGSTGEEQSEDDQVPAVPAPDPEQLAEFEGEYFSYELDATYRFSVSDDGFVVRIEQEPPVPVVKIAENEYRVDFYNEGLSGPQPARLEFTRDASGLVAGFRLSSGSEIGLIFDRRDSLCPSSTCNARQSGRSCRRAGPMQHRNCGRNH